MAGLKSVHAGRSFCHPIDFKIFISLFNTHFLMKNSFLLLSLLSLFFLCGCDSCEVVKVANGKLKFSDGKTTDMPHWNEEGWTHFFFVRHAERLSDTDNATDLSPAGYARARRLGHIMENAGLDFVFTTDFLRTRQTADLMREASPSIPARSLPSYSQDHDAETEFLQTQLRVNRGKRIFVVGHSNTVPRMINKLTGPGFILPDIRKDDYGNFFVVASYGLGNSKLLWEQY